MTLGLKRPMAKEGQKDPHPLSKLPRKAAIKKKKPAKAKKTSPDKEE